MNILVGLLTRGTRSDLCSDSIDSFVDYARSRGHVCEVGKLGGTLIDHGRSKIATEFLLRQKSFEVLLSLDDDMLLHDPPAVVRMCGDALRREIYVGAVYSRKTPLSPLNVEFLPGTSQVTFFEGGSIIEVQRIATGLCAAPRSVYQHLVQKLGLGLIEGAASHELIYPFFARRYYRDGILTQSHSQFESQPPQWLGPDYSLSELIRESGMGVFADTRVRVGHVGEYVYQIEDAFTGVPTRPSIVATFGAPETTASRSSVHEALR